MAKTEDRTRERIERYVDFITERGPAAVYGEPGATVWAGLTSRYPFLLEGDTPAWATDTTPAPEAEVDPAFEQQARLEQWLRGWTGNFEFLQSLQQQLLDRGRLSDKQWASASKCYEREQGWKAEIAAKTDPDNSNMAKPRAGLPGPRPELTDGMYKTDAGIFKVIHGVNGSGRQYAKLLVVDEDGKTVRFTYALGAIRKLTEADAMSLEDAKAFGALYGVCCVCGRTLTDEESIAAGIGPVCVGKGGWV